MTVIGEIVTIPILDSTQALKRGDIALSLHLDPSIHRVENSAHATLNLFYINTMKAYYRDSDVDEDVDVDVRSGDVRVHRPSSSPSNASTSKVATVESKASNGAGTEINRIDSALKHASIANDNNAAGGLKRAMNVDDGDMNRRSNDHDGDRSRQSINELVELLNGSKTIVKDDDDNNNDNDDRISCVIAGRHSQLIITSSLKEDTIKDDINNDDDDDVGIIRSNDLKSCATVNATSSADNHQYQSIVHPINAPSVPSSSSSSSSSVPLFSSSSSMLSSASSVPTPSVHLLDVSIQGTFDYLSLSSSSSPQHRLFGCYVSYHIFKDCNDLSEEKLLKRQLLWWDSECVVLNSSNRHRIECATTSLDDVYTALGLSSTQTYIEFNLHGCDEDGNLIDNTRGDGMSSSGSSSDDLDANDNGTILGKSFLPISDIYTLLNTPGSTTEYALPIIFTDPSSSSNVVKDVIDRKSKHVLRLSVSHRVEPILLLNSSIDIPAEQMTHPSSLLPPQQQQQHQPSSSSSSVNVSMSLPPQLPSVENNRDHYLGFDLSMKDLEDIILSRKKANAAVGGDGRNSGMNGAMWVPFIDIKEETKDSDYNCRNDEFKQPQLLSSSQLHSSSLPLSSSSSSSLMDVFAPVSCDMFITLEEYAHISIGMNKLNQPSVVCSVATKINPDLEVFGNI